jgi:rubrerythrin
MAQPWLLYFRSNQADPQEIPWQDVQPPSAEMAPFLIPSLQLFQLGEGARGMTFLELGRRHAESTGDLDFIETLALFISEEQRHSALLARYLRAVGAPLLERHWVDGIFRRLRKLAGLECMVTVLVTAEVVAVPYYRAVHRTSACPALRAICLRILREEAQHLLFQASTLAALQRARPDWWIRLTRFAQHVLLAGTCVTVWVQHGKLLHRGQVTFLNLVLTCRALLRHVHRAARSEEERRRVAEGLTQDQRRAASDAQHGTRSFADDRIQQ